MHSVEYALYREREAEAGRFLPSLVLNRLTSTSFTLSMTSPASTCKTNRFYENAFCWRSIGQEWQIAVRRNKRNLFALWLSAIRILAHRLAESLLCKYLATMICIFSKRNTWDFCTKYVELYIAILLNWTFIIKYFSFRK